MNKQNGFTMVELVFVIVILGILAAFAIPKFADLSTKARVANINAVLGSARASAAQAKALSVANGTDTAASSNVNMEGASVPTAYGYPTQAGLISSLNLSADYNTATVGEIQLNGAPTPASCKVTYAAAAAANTQPTFGTVITGC